ncbi:MAG: E1 ubiquitin-activating protein uba2 [Piccolia ochrophora]|nr:MAG: E1 ubiquitin-activating protein uba2 [Piccolia ochrophora]
MKGRNAYAKQSLGTLHARVQNARVLLIGAGGIGCELLKNLLLSGFAEIHVVDLDTIDLSNLNRQFLFRREHIKKSKALVAKETAGRFNPHVKIEAHHANIKDPKFNVDWFRSFNLVFNALDNLEARRHVNKMCLAADIPLIESGTTGFNGQVQVIKKGKTECYDCNSKETPKTFPVCTIRSTPSQPIHCIVWAKSYLFTEIFGTSEDDAPDLDHSEDSENATEIEQLRQEAQALKQIRASMGSDDFTRKVFEKVFDQDITRLRGMEDMWKARKPPEGLDYDLLSGEAANIDRFVVSNNQRTWTVAENVAVFSDSLKRLSQRLRKAQEASQRTEAAPILIFDKDDDDALDFVTASANLRSSAFGIETKSEFDVKQMAGNIIPAIATTNAMVAGLCVLQAFKILRERLDDARMVFLVKSTDRAISAEKLHPPKPDCPACSVVQSKLEVDVSRATLNDLVEDLLRVKLGYGEEFSVNSEVGTLYDPELDDNLPKRFIDLGVKADSFLTVIDEDDIDPRVNLVLSIEEKTLPPDSKPIVAPEKLEIGRRPKATPVPDTTPNGYANGVLPVNGAHSKPKRTAAEAQLDDDLVEHVDKKRRSNRAEADDVVVLDDESNGVFVIDD